MKIRTRTLQIYVLPLALTLVCAATPTSADAATNGFITPSFRGSANSEAGYWEIFNTPVGAPGNLADRARATTGAVLTQLEPQAFLTGSGNIYNLNGVSQFTVADTTPFSLGTVVLQARSLGAEIDYASVSLSYDDASGTHALAPLFRRELDRGSQPGLGTTVSSLWQWNLTGLDANSYTIAFNAAGPSLSFDSLTLDTWNQFTPVPEPSTWALLVCGTVALGCWRRFRA